MNDHLIHRIDHQAFLIATFFEYGLSKRWDTFFTWYGKDARWFVHYYDLLIFVHDLDILEKQAEKEKYFRIGVSASVGNKETSACSPFASEAWIYDLFL
jgi:hypothetical protein